MALEGPSLERVLAGASDGKEDDTAAAELADVEARLLGLAEAFAEGDISRAEWMRARRKLDQRATAARGLLHRRERSAALAAYSRPGALRDAWPQLETAQRRAIIGAVVDRITVKAATRRGPVFDPERVDVSWKV